MKICRSAFLQSIDRETQDSLSYSSKEVARERLHSSSWWGWIKVKWFWAQKDFGVSSNLSGGSNFKQTRHFVSKDAVLDLRAPVSPSSRSIESHSIDGCLSHSHSLNPCRVSHSVTEKLCAVSQTELSQLLNNNPSNDDDRDDHQHNILVYTKSIFRDLKRQSKKKSEKKNNSWCQAFEDLSFSFKITRRPDSLWSDSIRGGRSWWEEGLEIVCDNGKCYGKTSSFVPVVIPQAVYMTLFTLHGPNRVVLKLRMKSHLPRTSFPHSIYNSWDNIALKLCVLLLLCHYYAFPGWSSLKLLRKEYQCHDSSPFCGSVCDSFMSLKWATGKHTGIEADAHADYVWICLWWWWSDSRRLCRAWRT